VLQSENVKLGPGDKISIVNNSRGDIRSMLNSAQSRVSGYATISNKDIVDIDIADAVNGYFNAGTIDQATQFIANADASYPDARYGASPEDRRKESVSARLSSIDSSKVGREDRAYMLDVLSKADMVVGRAN